MAQLALFRATDPQTSRDAAEGQQPTLCERDILTALETFSFSDDPTAWDIWRSFMSWREYATVKTAFSRLVKAEKIVVTGRRAPEGKRFEQSTYRIA